ncbi:MAG TPA: hypothetical protein VJN02_03715 [Gammaproteobacteria bacterium]|nr:hypothetical protein [Gammaproteobacteria bacterium]
MTKSRGTTDNYKRLTTVDIVKTGKNGGVIYTTNIPLIDKPF